MDGITASVIPHNNLLFKPHELITERKFPHVNPLPHMPIMGSSNSAANKDMPKYGQIAYG